jgi:hypothetical protein
MKKIVALSAVALLAAAGAANAQSTLAGATLQLRIVPQTGTLGGPITDGTPGGVVNVSASDTNRTRRFEVQYRIQGADGVAAGLSSMQFNIVGQLVGGGIGFGLDRAQLSRFEAQLAGSTPPSSPDASGFASGTALTTAGLHRPFRGGIPTGGTNPVAPNNGNPANGIIPVGAQAINLITPLSLSQNDQGNTNVGQDSNAWYGLYSFVVNIPDASTGTDNNGDGFVDILLTATAVADAQTGNRWGGFEDQNPVPQTSANAVNGVAGLHIEIPAPGSLALVGLGGLLAARRRRA